MEFHALFKVVGESINPDENLELSPLGKMITVPRSPTGIHIPLKPVDDTGAVGGTGDKRYAFWDHQHQLPDVFSGSTISTAGSKGIVPAPTAGSDDRYLRVNGTWATLNVPLPADTIPLAPIEGGAIGNDTTHFALADHRHPLEPVFTGAGALSGGTRGAVPAPLAGQDKHFLQGSGSWQQLTLFLLAGVTETSYSGHGGKFLKVKTNETGIEFGSAVIPTAAINAPPKPYTDQGVLGVITTRFAREDHRHPLPDDMVGASSGASGARGLVPQPTTGQQERFLSGAGAWRGQFTTSYMGLVPKPTANDVTNAYPLRASGGWAPISFFEINEVNETTLSGHAGNYVRVASDGSALEFFNAISSATPAPTVGAPGSGFAQAGITQRFAREDHIHEMIVFSGPSTTGGVGAVPASTATDVSNGYFLRADGVWALPSGAPGGGVGIPDTTIQQKGDLIVGTGNASYGRLPVGTNGYILSANSAANAFGIEWIPNPLRDPATTTPLSPTAAGSIGTSLLYARADHRHPLPSNYQGATSGAAGVAGLVPPALATQQNHLFTGGGTWVAAPTTFTGPNSGGLVPNPGTGVTDRWLRSNGQWQPLNFFSLTDAPPDVYTGKGGQFIRVNDTDDGLDYQFLEPGSSLPSAATDTTGSAGSAIGGLDYYSRSNHRHPIDPVFSTSVRGSVPAPGTSPVAKAPKFLSDAATWYGTFQPGTFSNGVVTVDGRDGLVPRPPVSTPSTAVLTAGGTWATGLPASSLSLNSTSLLTATGTIAVNNGFTTQQSGSDTVPVWQNLVDGQSNPILIIPNVAAGSYLVVGRLLFTLITSSVANFLVQSRISNAGGTISTPSSPASFSYNDLDDNVGVGKIPYFNVRQCVFSDKITISQVSDLRVQVHVGSLDDDGVSAFDIRRYDQTSNPTVLNIGQGEGNFGKIPGLHTLEGSTFHLIKVG